MLSALLLIPIIGSLMLLPISEESQTGVKRIKQIALTASMVNFILSVVLWGEFDSGSVQYQFVQEFNNLSFCHLNIGIDGISLYFVLLTTFITPLCILSNWDNIKFGMKYFLIAFLLMETLLIAVFVVLDLMLFYIFFESVLIPMFLVVGIWGGSITRIRASFLLFLYTLAGSLFMLLSIMVIYYNVGSTDFTVVSLTDMSLKGQQVLWLGFFLSFAVKTPLVPLHIWLPRAHAEAPIRGSILLASVILKLATYGYLRILIFMLPDATSYFSPLVQTLAVVSIVYSSLATLRQSDFKALVAYSSVGHMGVIVLGLFSNTIVGIEGAILLSVRHGLISPAMFILVGQVLYDRFHTRIIRYYRGMTVYMPVFSVLFFLATACNMGVPLSLNWLGEALSLTGMFQKSPIISIIGASSIVLSACYSIFLFNRISFGAYSQYLTFTKDVSRREFMLLLPLLLLTFILGIMPNIILRDLHVSVTHMLYDLDLTPLNRLAVRVGVSEKRKQKVKEVFVKANATDIGLDTTNPHIIVRRIIERGGPYTLEDVNSVLKHTSLPEISKESFDTLTSLEKVDYTLPLPARRADLLGFAKTNKTVKQGIYIFTSLLDGKTRVGSAKNLRRRLNEHLSATNNKGSKLLRNAFFRQGINNFKLSIIHVPSTFTYYELLRLEQYYMLFLNSYYCPIKVVDTGLAKGVDCEVFKLREEQLYEYRLKTGKPVYIYDNKGVLLFICMSIGQFKDLGYSSRLMHNLYYNYVDTDKLYKQSLLISSTPKNYVTVPLYSGVEITTYLTSLKDIKYDYSTRSPDPKSISFTIKVYNTDGTVFEVVRSSLRDCANKLQKEGYNVSRKYITSLVQETKSSETVVGNRRDGLKFIITQTPYNNSNKSIC